MVTRRKKKGRRVKTKKISFYKTPPKLLTINGTHLLLLPLSASNSVKFECRIFGGGIMENDKNAGIAHLLEHVFMSAYKHCKNNDCEGYLDEYGIKSNAITHSTFTSYWLEGLPRFSDVMLKYITSIIFSPKITIESIKREKGAIRQELSSLLNDPDWQLSNNVNKILYKSKGLKNNENFKLQLKLLDRDWEKDLYKYIHDTVSKRCVLFTISGKFDRRTVINHFKQLANSYKNQTCAIEKLKLPSQCFTYKKKVVFVKNREAGNTNIVICFPVNIKRGDEYGIYLKVTSSILTGGLNSIMLKRLRDELHLIYSINMTSFTTYCGTLVVISTSTGDKNALRVLNEIFNIIQYYKKNNVPDRLLENYKLKYELNYNQISMTNPSVVSNFYTKQYFGQMNNRHKKIWTLQELRKKIKKLSPNIIKSVIKKTLNTSTCVVGYIGKKKIKFTTKDY